MRRGVSLVEGLVAALVIVVIGSAVMSALGGGRRGTRVAMDSLAAQQACARVLAVLEGMPLDELAVLRRTGVSVRVLVPGRLVLVRVQAECGGRRAALVTAMAGGLDDAS